jgi:hypothetical protein
MSEAENKALVEIAIKNLAMQSDARFKDVVSEIRAELNSFKSRISKSRPIPCGIYTHSSTDKQSMPRSGKV